MKILRLYNRTNFFFVSIAFCVSLFFNLKLIYYKNGLNKTTQIGLNTHITENVKVHDTFIKSQDFKNAKVVIENGDYFIPAYVIKESEYFGDYKLSEYYYLLETFTRRIFLSSLG
jgi:hypothetical protein